MAKVKYIPVDIYRITPTVFVGDFKYLVSFVRERLWVQKKIMQIYLKE